MGLHLSPGLMDLHVNYRDPGYDWKEDLNTGIQASAKGGFTSVLYMPSNNPSTNSKVQVDYIRNATKVSVVEVLPAGNVTVDHQGQQLTELYEMSQSGAKAFTDDSFSKFTKLLSVKAFQTRLSSSKTTSSAIFGPALRASYSDQS